MAGGRKKKVTAAEAAQEKLMMAQWEKTTSTLQSLTAMANGGLLPPAVLEVWRAPPAGERYLQTEEDEIVVFEDYFLRGLGIPVHNFLRDLCIFWRISIYNLIPNSILTIAIFIAYCEFYFGIPPHFILFRHFYYLKKGEGSGGSQIAGGCYVVLRDGMKANWMTIGHTSNTKNWMKKWFYINQNLEGRAVPCDVTQILVYNTRWSDRPSLAEMAQVNELIAMMDFSKVDGVLVASTFVIRRIQSLRERVNFMFE